MSRENTGVSLLRCLLIWTVVSAVTLVVLGELRVDLGWVSEPGFEPLLVTTCAWVLSACLAWFWLTTTLVLVAGIRGQAGRVRGCPEPVRRALLIACGLAALTVTSPASAEQTVGLPPAPTAPGPPTAVADDPTEAAAQGRAAQPKVGAASLAGLPLPDRQTGSLPSPPTPTDLRGRAAPRSGVPSAAPAPPRPRHATSVRHVVAPGDTLWSIAAASLPRSARDAEIDRRWREIWAANLSVVGSEPDLIHPGQRLDLPTPKETR